MNIHIKAIIVQLDGEFYINLIHGDKQIEVGDRYDGNCISSYSVKSAKAFLPSADERTASFISAGIAAAEKLNTEHWKDYSIAAIIN